MNCTPKFNVKRIIGGVQTVAVAMALTGWSGRAAPTSASFAVPESAQTNSHHVGAVSASDWRTPRSDLYVPVVSSSKSKHWLKRNAPILGGAGGGALVGGLVGGGTGAVVGGALGAGGGYLYKRHQHHRRERYRNERYRNEHYNRQHYQHYK